MDLLLQGYEVNPPTWLYLSSILTIALFFRFGRLFSLRNLDLVLLLSISPAILLLKLEPSSVLGNVWLFIVTTLVLVRVMLDGTAVRRPRIDPNLAPASMLFLGIAAFIFLSMQAIKGPTSPTTAKAVLNAEHILQGEKPEGEVIAVSTNADVVKTGPAADILATTAVTTSKQLVIGNDSYRGDDGLNTAGRIAGRIISISSHLAIIMGLYFIARWHFRDPVLGITMATLYLLMPCTAYKVGELHHVLPTALLVWGIACYELPILVGVLVGLASGTMFFPFFTLPIWLVFYGKKQWLAFTIGLGSVWLGLTATMLFVSDDGYSIVANVLGTIDWSALSFNAPRATEGFFGILFHPAYRIPMMVGYVVLIVFCSISMMKNTMENLVAQLAAVIVGTQFWYPQEGGVYVLWYLPMMLMLMFRPRMIHRVESQENGTIPMAENSYPYPATDYRAISRASVVFNNSLSSQP